MGTVLGSNITNVFLVLGITAVAKKTCRIQRDLLRFDLPMLLGAAFMLAVMIWDEDFSMGEAVLCLVSLVIYLASSFSKEHRERVEEEADGDKVGVKTWFVLLGGSSLVFLGSKFAIDSVVSISGMLGIGAEVIAMSAVALGTSLAEVTVSVSAAVRGNPELAIGNVVGSNIFNTLAVMGVAALFGPLSIPHSVIGFSLPLSLIAALMCVVIIVDRKMNRFEGALLLVFYLLFIGELFEVI